MGVASLVTLSLMVASTAYWVLCLVGALKFLSRRPPERSEAAPAVTVLKPVRGLDPDLAENCRDFCRQDYPVYQVVFGVADPQDPAIPLLQRVLQESPVDQHRLVIGPQVYGPNRKVSLLQQMLPVAAHEIVVISDSDVKVGPDYLRCIAAPFLDQTVGLVTCLYRGDGAEGLAARLEQLAIESAFAPSVMAAYAIEGVTFAFGSTLAIRRTILEKVGGFIPFVDLLADDYHLAQEARRQGYRLILSDYPVACVLGRSRFCEVFDRLVRWGRTNRASRPIGYLLSGISHGTIFSLVYLFLNRFSPAALVAAAATIGVRAAAAYVVGAFILKSRCAAAQLTLLLPGDLVTFLAWTLSVAGRRIRWRGTLYRIAEGGRLIEEGEADPSNSSR
ncbi:MAG: bacteriohopanetetrol glucosamine biosynthesis glycosyltransferase HpnI [candidate division NC10 bacterium]|nr:bacteriohopanetetrol glucosamine biosynthesis glycosyltransferase HpnI [candidate division NC10 bacterium]